MHKNLARMLAVILSLYLSQSGICDSDSGNDIVGTDVEINVDNSPFKQGNETIAEDNVVGVRIISKGTENIKVCLLSKDYKSNVSDRNITDIISDMNFFNRYPQLISVEISGVELNTTLCESLQKYLPHNLQSLIFDNCKLSDGVDKIINVLNEHIDLLSLTIRNYDLSAEDVNNLLNSLTQFKKLIFLNLGLKSIDDNGLQQLSGIISGLALRQLALSWMETAASDETYGTFFNTLQSAQALTSLEISFMESTQACMDSLLAAIGQLQKLTDLHLFFGNLDKHDSVAVYKSAEILGNSLKNLSNLAFFNIAYTNWPAEALCLIFQGLQPATLKLINASGNTFDVKSAEMLGNVIKQTPQIKTLFVNSCQMTDEVFSALSKLLSDTPLSYLHVAVNKISGAASSLPIKSMSNLVLYNLSSNELTYEHALRVMEQADGHEKTLAINFNNNKPMEEAPLDEKAKYRAKMAEISVKNDRLKCIGN